MKGGFDMKKNILPILFVICVLLFSGALIAASASSDGLVLKGPNGVQRVSDGKSHGAILDVVYPSGANDLVVEYAEVFAERLSELLGQEVRACDSFASYLSSAWVARIFIGEEYDNSLYVEYLTAKNDGLLPFMPESDEDWGKYTGTVSTYSMFVDREGLHINASDEWALYWAIDDLLKELEISETYVLNVGTKVLIGEDYVFPDPTEFIGKGVNPYFAVTEKVAELPAIVDCVDISEYSDSLQGGGTDGEYAYIGTDGMGDLGKIFKYSLPEWELVDVSDPILVKHANAISYIAEKNLLTVAHCTDGDVRGFAYVDPLTLEVVDYGSTPVDCWGLEYDNANERFIVEVNWKHYIFDKDFNLINELTYGDRDGTPQTLFVDGKYTYDVRDNVPWDTGHSRSTPYPEHGQDYITVHDYENVYIEKAPIPNLVGEVEHMFRHGNLYYIGYIDNIVDGKENPYGVVYEFVILPEIWWK